MADSSALADLLDRASKVFSLAGKLGRAFQTERESQHGQIAAKDWSRHATTFDGFCRALLDLRDAMLTPPNGFAPVAEVLIEASRIAKELRAVIQTEEGQTWATHLDYFPELNSIDKKGRQAVDELRRITRLDDPFAFVEDAASVKKLEIDTTPAMPRPHAERVEKAARDIPKILENVAPSYDGRIEIPASHLAKRLQDAEHTLAAAQWAIHESVLAGRLQPRFIVFDLPKAGRLISNPMRYWGGRDDRRMEWIGGGKGTVAIPKGQPVSFDNFKVMATESLWEWWHSPAVVDSCTDNADAKTEAFNHDPSEPASKSTMENSELGDSATVTDDVEEQHSEPHSFRALLGKFLVAATAHGEGRVYLVIQRCRTDGTIAEPPANLPGIGGGPVCIRSLGSILDETSETLAYMLVSGISEHDQAAADKWLNLARMGGNLLLATPSVFPGIPRPLTGSETLWSERTFRLVSNARADLIGETWFDAAFQASVVACRILAERVESQLPGSEIRQPAVNKSAGEAPAGTSGYQEIVSEDTEADAGTHKAAESVVNSSAPTKSKRSTERGEARTKVIAALTKHHKYADGGCLNLEPIGNNELARFANVAKRTASAFFNKEFQGHAKYRSLCNDPSRLVAALKALNGEFRPHDFYDVRTRAELEPDDE